MKLTLSDIAANKSSRYLVSVMFDTALRTLPVMSGVISEQNELGNKYIRITLTATNLHLLD